MGHRNGGIMDNNDLMRLTGMGAVVVVLIVAFLLVEFGPGLLDKITGRKPDKE